MEELISKSHKYSKVWSQNARFGTLKLAQIVGERQGLGTKAKEDWNIFARRSVQHIRADKLKGREVHITKTAMEWEEIIRNKSCKLRKRTTVEKQSRSKARWKWKSNLEQGKCLHTIYKRKEN